MELNVPENIVRDGDGSRLVRYFTYVKRVWQSNFIYVMVPLFMFGMVFYYFMFNNSLKSTIHSTCFKDMKEESKSQDDSTIDDRYIGVYFDKDIKPYKEYYARPTETILRVVQEPKVFRLPDHIYPAYYDLEIKSYINGGYSGVVTILLNIHNKTDNITLHAGEQITIQQVLIQYDIAVDFSPADTVRNYTVNYKKNRGKVVMLKNAVFRRRREEDLLIIESKKVVHIDKAKLYVVQIVFTSSVNDNLGFYRTDFKYEDNSTRPIEFANFRPIYAREAFPCFDEPNIRSDYRITLPKFKKVFPDFTTYDFGQERVDFWSKDLSSEEEWLHNPTFTSTIEKKFLSPYQLSFLICNLPYNSSKIYPNEHDDRIRGKRDERLFLIHIYTVYKDIKYREWTLQFIYKMLQQNAIYFDRIYPHSKIDFVALPNYISQNSGSVGVLTMPETNLLYNNNTYTAQDLQRVALSIAHEMTFWWLGTSINLEWWDDVWIQQGLTIFLKYKSVHEVNKNWAMEEQFLIHELYPALAIDATPQARPLIEPINNKSGIIEKPLFDTLQYKKAAALFRMLNQCIGSSLFQETLQNFAQLKQYKPINSSHLFSEDTVTELQNFDEEIYHTFANQPGYPIVTVKLNKNGYGFTVTQEPFSIFPKSIEEIKDRLYLYNESNLLRNLTQRWTIPIFYRRGATDNEKIVIFKANMKELIVDSDIQCNETLRVNPSGIGYYRVNYADNIIWENQIENYKKSSIAERTNLIENLFTLAKAGIVKYGLALELTKQLVDETDYVPLHAFCTVSEEILDYMQWLLLTNIDVNGHFARVIFMAYDKYVTRRNELKIDDHLGRLTFSLLSEFGCKLEVYQYCESEWDQLESFMLGKTAFSLPEFRYYVYMYSIKPSWETVYDDFLVDNKMDSNERLKIIQALANPETAKIESLLTRSAFGQKFVKGHEYFAMLRYLSDNRVGNYFVWDYVRNKWSKLIKHFSLDNPELVTLIPYVTRKYSKERNYEEMLRFYNSHKLQGFGAEQALANVRTRINMESVWRIKYQKDVEDWMASEGFKN